MDWKTKIVLPPNYVSLRRLKELREKEKAELELKIREEAEAEYRLRLEEEERLKKLKEDEEKTRIDEEMRLKEEVEKRRIDEEKRQKEEEERQKREKEEEDRLRREIIRRDQILRTITLLCGEPSRTRRNGLKKYSDDDDDDQINKEVVAQVIKDENLEERKKKKKKKWGKKKKKKDYEKETLELESQETLKSETKSSEEEKAVPKPNGFKTRRQRNLEAKKKIEMNQNVEEEEIERKIGNLNVDDKMKMVKKSKAESQTLKSETKSIEVIPPDTKPSGWRTRRQKAKGIVDKKIEKVEEEIEKQIGDLNVNNTVDNKKHTGVKNGDKFRIENIQKHGRRTNLDVASQYAASALRWFPAGVLQFSIGWMFCALVFQRLWLGTPAFPDNDRSS